MLSRNDSVIAAIARGPVEDLAEHGHGGRFIVSSLKVVKFGRVTS
jgi:hypothetical protein